MRPKNVTKNEGIFNLKKYVFSGIYFMAALLLILKIGITCEICEIIIFFLILV